MEKSLIFRDATLSYLDMGSGKTVMLLHGFGETGEVWKFQAAHLQSTFRVIVPDLPGSGKSGFIDMEPPSLDLYADAVVKILNAEQISEVILIGHSMGGYIAMAVAEIYPQYISGLGLFHSSSFADDEEKIKSREKGIEFIKSHGPEAFLRTTIPNLFADGGSSLKDRLMAEADAFSGEALIYYYRAMINRPDRSHILKDFSKPFLLVMGEKDKAVPFDISLKQTYLAEVSFIEVLRNSAHMGMLEEPDKANRILTKFLQCF
jgi:pimeloyl-ACP methyl ester carboxylesterase